MKIAIQGHPTRGKEIIQILRSLGATSYGTYDTCSHPEWYWYINKNREITCDPKRSMCGYKLYTLEKFEKEFSFKIGDKVIFPVKTGWASGKITNLTYIEDKLKYEVYVRTSGYHYVEPHKLSLYPMKEERNITLTLEKAKEWYKKGGELREIALQAFTEKELIALPRSWDEFCKDNPVRKGECFIGSADKISVVQLDDGNRIYKNWIPSKKSAEAHLAMIQLEQLRNCWWNGWEPEWNNSTQAKYCIIHYGEEFKTTILFETRYFLSFPTREMAEEFLECFRDLIKKAGDLI